MEKSKKEIWEEECIRRLKCSGDSYYLSIYNVIYKRLHHLDYSNKPAPVDFAEGYNNCDIDWGDKCNKLGVKRLAESILRDIFSHCDIDHENTINKLLNIYMDSLISCLSGQSIFFKHENRDSGINSGKENYKIDLHFADDRVLALAAVHTENIHV